MPRGRGRGRWVLGRTGRPLEYPVTLGNFAGNHTPGYDFQQGQGFPGAQVRISCWTPLLSAHGPSRVSLSASLLSRAWSLLGR